MKGKIMKVKHGYNPNSSSMGSMVFAMPIVFIGATVGFGVISSLIVSYFMRMGNKNKDISNETSHQLEKNE